MIVSIIAALDEAGGIGRDNRLPWRLATDLKRFKKLTLGHHIVMGRKTWESIGRLLPGRRTIVISRQARYTIPGAVVAQSLKAALLIAESYGEVEAFIIGGSQIYSQGIPLAQRMYLTRVHAHLAADIFFPTYEASEWQEIHREIVPADMENEYASTFYILEHTPVVNWRNDSIAQN